MRQLVQIEMFPRAELITMVYFLWSILLCLPGFFICSQSVLTEYSMDIKVLNVGEELERETLPLNKGIHIYQIHGLKESLFYEVKISYPASIPASFSIQLKEDVPELWLKRNRRLLNTEKVIFKYDSKNLSSRRGEIYALVSVEAEGIVAKRSVQEREVVLFNIVCDELMLGVPHKAWWVGIAAILCLLWASAISYYFPPHVLLRSQSSQPTNPALSKIS